MLLKRILGNNRLAQDIFSKTEPEEESLIKNQEPSFLIDSKKEKINLRLSLELIVDHDLATQLICIGRNISTNADQLGS